MHSISPTSTAVSDYQDASYVLLGRFAYTLNFIFDGDLQTGHMYAHSFYCITKIIASRCNDSCIEYVVSYSSFSCIKHGCKIPPWLTLDKARIID
jgi:hypothetical protein